MAAEAVTGTLPRGPDAVAAGAAAAERRLAAADVGAVTLLAAILRFAGFGGVAPNPYYDAAVRSMSLSWHNFFYGAFEPGAQVSVDKIPVDLWLQVLSVKLLGFSSAALRLPEALAATAAVPMLYAVVARLFGRAAGLAAALALAVLPLSVLTGRSDTMDSVMMALLVGAALLAVAGAQRGRPALVVAAGAVAGLAFNVKLFEALIALPALAVLALLILDGGGRERARLLALAAAAFLVTSLSWLLAGSLLGGANRPWPIGSTNGSAWNVVFGFNGLDRLRDPATASVRLFDPAGPLRLFGAGGRGYGMLIGSLLAGAVIVGALAAADALLGARRWAVTPAGRAPRAGAAWLAVWLGTGFVLFSRMQRVQTRYLEAFTPAVAAVAGVGIAALAAAALRRPRAAVALAAAALRRPRAAVALAAGAALTAALAPGIGGAPGWAAALAVAAAIATAGLAALAIALRGRGPAPALRAALTVAALAAVLAVPLAGAMQIAGGSSSNSGHAGTMPAAQVTALSRFLRANQGGARYEVASSTVAKAGPLIVRDGRPVLMLTSLHGRPLLTPARLAALVRTGQVRYALLGRGTCSPRSALPCAPVVGWARAHATDVSAHAGLGRTGFLWQLGTARTR